MQPKFHLSIEGIGNKSELRANLNVILTAKAIRLIKFMRLDLR
jgi:hypothetical protein